MKWFVVKVHYKDDHTNDYRITMSVLAPDVLVALDTVIAKFSMDRKFVQVVNVGPPEKKAN